MPTIVITIFVFGSITIVILYFNGSIDTYAALLDVEDELELAVELAGLVGFAELGMLFRAGVGDAIANKGVEVCFVEFSVFFMLESDVFFTISIVSASTGWTTELSDLFKLLATIFVVELVIMLVDIFVYYFLIWFFATNEISLAPGMPKFFSVCSHFPDPLY